MLHSQGATYSDIVGKEALGNVGITFLWQPGAGHTGRRDYLNHHRHCAGILLKKTTFGWHIFAIGGNEKAAKLSGIKVDKVKILVYIFSAVCAAIVGIITAAQLEASHPASGEPGK
jgi:erythritol transport system permease protein